MPALTVRLFGRFSICYGQEALEGSIPGKAKELFCYLLIHRQRPLNRESLAGILWENCTAERSKQYLRKTLWQLQHILRNSSAYARPVLQVNSQSVSVNPEAELWVDVVEFERLYSGGRSKSWVADSSVENLETAVALYRGDFLEGWYRDWCLHDRERLQNAYVVMLGELIVRAEAKREYEKGVEYAMRILGCDRAHEVAHQRLMRLRYLSGDRAGALRQYEACVAALKEELGVQPSSDTRRLFRQISEERVVVVSQSESEGQMAQHDEFLLLEGALGQLVEVQAALAVVQKAVDDILERVRRALQASNRGSDPGA